MRLLEGNANRSFSLTNFSDLYLLARLQSPFTYPVRADGIEHDVSGLLVLSVADGTMFLS
jgi:hypothetical protein